MFYLGNIHCMTRTGTDVMKLGLIWHVKRGYGLYSFTWAPWKLKFEKNYLHAIEHHSKVTIIGFNIVNKPFQIYNISLYRNSQYIQEKNSYIS